LETAEIVWTKSTKMTQTVIKQQIKMYKTAAHHKLNGSSSPVLTDTPHSNGKGQNSTPYKIKTPERIGMKFGTVD